MFDPKAHLIQLPRRVKDPVTGHFSTRHDEYLEVKWRLVWFRDKYPHGTIITETVLLNWDKGVCIHRAHVGDGEGGIATGTGTETRKSFEDFIEKSETRAIGRALAALGIGTQFVGEELSEGEHVADAPVTAHVTSSNPSPLPAGESPSPGPAEGHPSADEITKLVDTARAANVDLEAFGHDMRRLMQLPDGQKVTKKFLRERMTMDQYNTARAHYGDALRQVLKQDVPDFPPQKEPTDGTPTPTSPVSETALPSASVSESNAAEETTPTVPSASSSAPASAHAEVDQARDKLRQEALNWQIQRVEIEHILAHHDLAKARNILWKARRNTPAPTWVAAAD